MSIYDQALQRKVGWLIALAAAATLVIALVQQPFSQWPSVAWLLMGALVLIAAAGIYAGITGKLYTSKSSLKSQRTGAIVVIVLMALGLLLLLLSGLSAWTVLDTMSTGFFLIAFVTFVIQIVIVNRALKEQG